MAIAAAVAERLKGRAGNPRRKTNSGNISLIDSGQTRDLAAAKAGLGSGKTLEAAQAVVAKGTPELSSAGGAENFYAALVVNLKKPEWATGVARPQQEGFTFSYGGLDGG